MKRKWLFGLCVLLITLQLASCLRSPAPELPDTTSTEGSPTLPSPDTNDTPLLPTWESADAAAEVFFADAKNAVVDHSARDYSYAEMEEDLSILAAAYPSLFSYRSFGKSLDGRELYVAILGNPNAEKSVLVSAGIHGREYLTPLLAMKQIEFYLQYYEVGDYGGTDYRTLLDSCLFYIVPMSNPDGIMLSQEGLSSLRSAELRATVQAVYARDKAKGYTSQTDIDEYLKFWKANARGVDLNRNFDAQWESYRKGEYEPCHKNYKGPSAASEPETQALAALTESIAGLQAVLCIHSQGEVLYWDCGQNAPLHDATLAFTNAIAASNGYEVVMEQNNDASFSDWCALNKDLIAVTVETGNGTCPLFIDKFTAIWFDNFDLLAMTAKYLTK